MSRSSKGRWAWVERWRATAFLIGGAIFVLDAALLAVHLSAGTEPAALGQALVGASWTAAFVGLLGFYPGLADRSRWLARAGAVFAVVGAIAMAAMAVTSLGYATGVLGGELADVVMVFLPPIFVGIVLGFGSFAFAGLRTGTHSRRMGLLLTLLPLTFLFNVGTGIAGFNPLPKVLGVVTLLALTMLAIGYLLRTGGAKVDEADVGASGDVGAG